MTRHLPWRPLVVLLLWAALDPAAAPAQGFAEADEIDRLRTEAARLASQQVRRAHDAIPLYRQAIARARASRDAGRAAEALAGLGAAFRSTNQPSAAIAALEGAVAAARLARQPSTEAEAFRLLGILAIENGEYRPGRAAVVARRRDCPGGDAYG